MEMRCLAAALGNKVDINVEQPTTDRYDLGEPRFLDRLSQCDPCDITLTISMATRLEPSIQLAMVCK